MIVSYHNVCPRCGEVNKVDVLIGEDRGGKSLVTCIKCGKDYVFGVYVKKVEE